MLAHLFFEGGRLICNLMLQFYKYEKKHPAIRMCLSFIDRSGSTKKTSQDKY